MKKFLSLVLSMFMIFGLVACGSSSSNATSATNAPVSENATVETEAAKKKLVMCTNAEFPPYEYHDGNNIIGIDVDIINAIAKMKGFDVEIMDIAFDATIPSVMSGKADFGEEHILRYHKNTDGFQGLKSGKVDAFVIDDQVAKALVAEDGGEYVILDSAYALEEYAIAVKKGNTEILNMLNEGIDELKANGELQKIIDKYIE